MLALSLQRLGHQVSMASTGTKTRTDWCRDDAFPQGGAIYSGQGAPTQPHEDRLTEGQQLQAGFAGVLGRPQRYRASAKGEPSVSLAVKPNRYVLISGSSLICRGLMDRISGVTLTSLVVYVGRQVGKKWWAKAENVSSTWG